MANNCATFCGTTPVCAPPSCAGSTPPVVGFVWVDASCGHIPPNAFIGGQQCCGQLISIIRAQYECALIPGMLVSSQGCAFVSWGGVEHKVTQYQVLVDGHYIWISTHGSNIPTGAIPAGEADGEPLFIGRVRYEGRIIIGTVQMSKGFCYVFVNGKELAFSVYEILMPAAPPVPNNPESFKWVDDSCGGVPPGTVVGGQNCSGKPVYVVRAHHRCSLTPGMLISGHDSAKVPWGNSSHAKDRYQVLVGGPCHWVWTNGANIPPGALTGGKTENGETLYIGRVHHKGNIIPGKVQGSENVCYIAFGEKELSFRVYEILMSTSPVSAIDDCGCTGP